MEYGRTLNLVLTPTTLPLPMIDLPMSGPEPRDSPSCSSLESMFTSQGMYEDTK